MSNITVKEFSKTIGLSSVRLIEQLQLAGIEKKSEDDLISDEEKMQLLEFFRNEPAKNKTIKKDIEKSEDSIDEKQKTKTVIRKKRVFSKVNNQVTKKIEADTSEKHDEDLSKIDEDENNLSSEEFVETQDISAQDIKNETPLSLSLIHI